MHGARAVAARRHLHVRRSCARGIAAPLQRSLYPIALFVVGHLFLGHLGTNFAKDSGFAKLEWHLPQGALRLSVALVTFLRFMALGIKLSR